MAKKIKHRGHRAFLFFSASLYALCGWYWNDSSPVSSSISRCTGICHLTLPPQPVRAAVWQPALWIRVSFVSTSKSRVFWLDQSGLSWDETPELSHSMKSPINSGTSSGGGGIKITSPVILLPTYTWSSLYFPSCSGFSKVSFVISFCNFKTVFSVILSCSWYFSIFCAPNLYWSQLFSFL